MFVVPVIKILDVFCFQGVRRQEQSAMADLYRVRNPSDSSVAMGNRGQGSGPATRQASTGSAGHSVTTGLLRGLGADLESSRIKKLEKLIKKRL